MEPERTFPQQHSAGPGSSAWLLRGADYSQAVDHGASLPTLPLPLVHLSEQVEERLLGVGNVAVRRPAEELELAHHQLALLKLHMTKEGKEEEERNQPRRRRALRASHIPPTAAQVHACVSLPPGLPCFSVR